MEFYLSKTDFDKYLVHPAYLWLQKNQKNKLPDVDDNLQFIFDQGHAFEAVARQLFPQGALVDAKAWEFDDLINQTQALLEQDQPVIFQATFRTERRLLCKVDILVKKGQAWDIYEVKSGASRRDKYIQDVAFQTIALEAAGLEVGDQHLILVNSKYRRKGEIDPEGITKIEDVTTDVAQAKQEVDKMIEEALKVARSTECPDLSPTNATRVKDWWEVFFHLNSNLPPESIYYLRKAKSDLLEKLERQGIETMTQITETSDLTEPQKLQVESAKTREPVVKPEQIQKFIDRLEYPLYFLDYETVGYVLPLFEGTRPRQQVPFEYSLHILERPGDELEHCEFVSQAIDGQKPTKPMLDHLSQHIGQQGSVVVWYQRFEKGRNKDMAKWHPEHAEMLENVNERIVDLREPFAKHNYVDWRFKGSTSLKNVLPVLAPELSYEELGVSEGMAALRTWYQLLTEENDAAVMEETYRNLREYCALDTLAMAHILEQLEATVAAVGLNTASSQPSQAELF